MQKKFEHPILKYYKIMKNCDMKKEALEIVSRNWPLWASSS